MPAETITVKCSVAFALRNEGAAAIGEPALRRLAAHRIEKLEAAMTHVPISDNEGVDVQHMFVVVIECLSELAKHQLAAPGGMALAHIIQQEVVAVAAAQRAAVQGVPNAG